MMPSRTRSYRPNLIKTDRSEPGVIEHHWRFTHHPRMTIILHIAGGGATFRHIVDGIECVSLEAALARLQQPPMSEQADG